MSVVQTLVNRIKNDLTLRLSPISGQLDDLICHESGSEWEHNENSQLPDHRLRCIWWHVTETNANGETWTGYRVIKVSELTYLPREARADPALIQKQASLLRGLYAARVELITLSFGIFSPPIGIVQCYGAAVRQVGNGAAAKQRAFDLADQSHAAVVASLAAQFPQSRWSLLDVTRAVSLADALYQMPHVTTLIGQPDPREGARGGGAASSPAGQKMVAGAIFGEQQNEIMFRAMSRAKEEFLFLNIATPVARSHIAAQLESLADLTSPIASRQQGVTSIGIGVSLPMILSAGTGQSAGQNYGESQSQGMSDTRALAQGTAHSDGVTNASSWSHTKGLAHTDGRAVTDSIAHTTGVTHSHAVSQGTSQNWGQAHTDSVANTVGVSHVTSTGVSTGGSAGSSFGVSNGWGHSEGVSTNSTTSDGASLSSNQSASLGSEAGGSLGIVKAGVSGSMSVGSGQSVSSSNSDSVGANSSNSISGGTNMGFSSGANWANSSGESFGTFSSTTVGHADTVSQGFGTSSSTTNASGSFESTTVGHATTKSESDTKSEAWSEGGSYAVSSSDSVSESRSSAHGVTNAFGLSQGRSLGTSNMTGIGMGVAPSASVSKSFQWKDEAAIAVTQLLEQQINILKEASEEGGFYSDAYVLTRTANGRAVVESAAVQAFGGSQGVVTHIQPRRPRDEEEAHHLRLHARTTMPSTLTETMGWINGYAFSTLLTPTQQAAYTAPGLFEEGTALTIQERIPPFAFRPNMTGEAMLGFQFSTERGELTEARVLLTEDRHAHTAFAADTGFGKTVAAERLAVEVCQRWKHRVVALDFGAGWRRLLNGPLLRHRVDIYQLYPGAVRSLRWNPLKIGRRIPPEQQLGATVELIVSAGRMGPRQMGFLKRALRQLYVEAGVMVASVSDDVDSALIQKWRVLQSDEIDIVRRVREERGLSTGTLPSAGSELSQLVSFERQAVFVYRSRVVTLIRLYERLREYEAKLPVTDRVDRPSLEGLVLRLEPFTIGEMALMYNSENSIAIEDLGLLGDEPQIADRYGLCILEGGASMDEYSKVVVFSLVAWHLYNDAINRRRETIGGFNRPLDIVFEESNKVLTGVSNLDSSSDSGSGAALATSLWETMWRDGSKYKIFLHPLAQSVHALPSGIVSSCNNIFIGQTKDLKDRDLLMGHLARSEKGFTDEEYKRFLSRIPKKFAVSKFGASDDVAEIEPMYMQPLRVPGVEPTDTEILSRFGNGY